MPTFSIHFSRVFAFFCISILSFSSLCMGRETLDAQGGPDLFGYRYVDNLNGDTATFAWIELCDDPIAQNITSGDNSSVEFTLSFSFSFYGVNYTSLWISTNGLLSFTSPDFDFFNLCPYGELSPIEPQIAAFWDDFTCEFEGGCDDDGLGPWVLARDFGDRVVIEWRNVTHTANPSARFSIEAILFASGAIKLQYTDFNLTAESASSPSVGIDDPANFSYGLTYLCENIGTPVAAGSNRAVWFYVSPPDAHDFSCGTVQSPASEVLVGSEVTVSATFVNRGTTEEASPVKYRFNGGAIQSEMSPVLPSFGIDYHTFTVTFFAPPVPGDYPLDIWTELGTDANPANDSCHFVLTVRSCADFSETAPFTTPVRSSCANDDCFLVPGSDHIYEIVIPVAGTWTFTLCDPGTNYDSYLALMDGCCESIIVSNDDASSCAIGHWRSEIHCEPLAAGTYYLTIEGYEGGCGNYLLDVYSCSLTPCDSPLAVTAIRVSSLQDSVRIDFQSPATGNYKLWRTTNKNNDGNPDEGADADWSMVSEQTFNAGFVTFRDSPILSYANYVITQNCSPALIQGIKPAH